MSRVLVTGGAGFLGTNLSKRLLASGADVTVLDNLTSPSPLGIPPGVTFIEGDVVDPPSPLGPFDRIYHLASPASPPRYLQQRVHTLRTGAEGTRQILDLALGWNAGVLFTSTSEVYGDPEIHPQPESYRGAVSLVSPRACYDEGKRYAEALAYAYRFEKGSDVRVARIFNTFGPGMDPDDGRVVSNLIMQGLRGQPYTFYGDGSQTRSFCFVDDLVGGLVKLADSDVMDPVNLGNTEELTIRELADLISDRLGNHGYEFGPLPDSDPARRRPDLTRARTQLGWEPSTPLADGLDRTIEYFRGLA